MRLLLDTHSLIWAADEPSRLGADAVAALQDRENELLLGAGTLWELSIKIGLGKLALSLPFRDWISKAISDLEISVLPITVEYATQQTTLPFHHRDPFDRLLVAQALIEHVPIVSRDVVFDKYGLKRCW